MDEWRDAWMDGGREGWTDREMNDGWRDGLDGQMDGWIYGCSIMQGDGCCVSHQLLLIFVKYS